MVSFLWGCYAQLENVNYTASGLSVQGEAGWQTPVMEYLGPITARPEVDSQGEVLGKMEGDRTAVCGRVVPESLP